MGKNLETKYNELLKKNEEKSYLSYLTSDGIKAEDRYYDSLRTAETQKAIKDTNYGSKASELASMGLGISGYEDYLKNVTEQNYQKTLSNAKRTYLSDEYKNVSGYQKYLSDYEALQKKISESVIESIADGSDFDIENAYAAAVKAGVSRELAMYTATSGVNKAKENTMQKAITFAKLNSLSPNEAKDYAKSLGLDDSYAQKVYDSISVFNEEQKGYFSSMSAENYYDYIMSQSKKN